ncbi:uncharacterized protein Z518_06733 [Rhinocladiella mackenziei CBS 650.93]|uniref:Rhinocladiella mackenziei CBS 650.93 unplaced genomic scaffold supercont1.5, whole genome shotgun sequence n=1 Tax=Rhinocladiella mackenziei CBS 650.93 TaxID=1442369 RepID=A0A0D2IIQ9_9EURO|nr:uncharacterized protein Z518_06733 [Rhinocladiella mackenziei CBS 650.93]KIX03181.1 hypothetical protein Z518_06733 [Rhinocladiella mackenziei CBS 650.93]
MAAPNPAPCDEISKSTFYTMIPSVVRSRIPILTSLRHSARSIVIASVVRRRAYTLSCIESTKEKETTHGYAFTIPSSGTSAPTIRPDSSEGRLSSQELSLGVLPQPETRSGVDWDVAATGVRLWVTAKTQAEQGGEPTALRSMHIDALRYMHMALPSDLTPLEIESLRASMSPQLIFRSAEITDVQARRSPNILRQGVAQAICWLFAGFLFVLPFIMTFLNRILQFERQHQVTERVIANGLDLTTTLGERSLLWQKALIRVKNGRVGGACIDAGSWFLEGIIGGVNDGIDAVARSRRKTP